MSAVLGITRKEIWLGLVGAFKVWQARWPCEIVTMGLPDEDAACRRQCKE